MEKIVRPLFDTARAAAREQTGLMVSEFARDLLESVQQFGVEATRETIPVMIRGPKDVVHGVCERLGDAEDDSARERVAKYLEEHLLELWWYQEQLEMAITDLVRHGTVEMHGDQLERLVLLSMPQVAEMSG